jgi:2-dehydro-3-deoxygluconokinase
VTHPVTPRFDVTALGEVMLRLSVGVGERLETMTGLAVHLGGAEGNVCAALAALGRRCALFSRVPTGPLGEFVLRTLRAAGVDTAGVARAEGTRLGTYYVAFAAAPRATEVLYDRAGSAFSGLTPEAVAWDALLNTRVLHLTGITPALGEGPFAVTLEAVRRAKGRGVTVSFDVNYRGKLWPPETARTRLEALLPWVDLLICGQGDAQRVFGLEGSASSVLASLHALTPAQHVILTRGHEGAALRLGGEVVSVAARAATVVDRLGAGDAFAAGVLDGYLEGDVLAGLRRGAALSALALAQRGDMLVTDRNELRSVLAATPEALNR